MDKSVLSYHQFVLFLGVICAYCLCNVQLQQPGTKFSCQGRPSGYYADVPAGCQIYHMCDTLGRQFSYSCPNTTLFQQRMLICDHWYMVNCSKSEIDYDANLLIGQRGKPFVEDDDEHPYHRTPRPDLLAHPSASEYNIVYRTGRAQHPNQKNLIGGDTDYPDSTDHPYFLPSHWSTDYRKSTTQPPTQKEQRTKKPYYPKAETTVPIQVNFRSDYKATTPVYPKIAPTEIPLQAEDFEITGPKVVLQAPPTGQVQEDFNFHPPAKAKVNFESNFRATTPVYPTFVTSEEPLANEELPPIPNLPYGLSSIVEPPKAINDLEYRGSQQQPDQQNPKQPINNHQVIVNFESSFKATTPVYPKSVTPEDPLAIQEQLVDPNRPSLSTVIQPPRGYSQNQQNTLIEPSIFFQPPLTPQDPNEIQDPVESRSPFLDTNEPSAKFVIANLNWKELRRALFIPDVQLPLDASAIRPTYDQGPNSFQVNPVTYELRQRKHATRK